MNNVETKFMTALKASIEGVHVEWSEPVSDEDWQDLMLLAEKQHVLPMIFDAVYNCPAISGMDPGMLFQLRNYVIQQMTVQTMKTAEFLRVYGSLAESGIQPLVVKGIICRNLYPEPDYRQSSDEDLLVEPECYAFCHEILTSIGLMPSDPNMDRQIEFEVPYEKAGSPLYIEVHKALFAPESDVCGDLNRYFERSEENARTVIVDGIAIRTLSHTDHLLYLILHAFKHFIYSGFGIRQLCDIILYANSYGTEIHWEKILEDLRQIRADCFAATLFRIGENYLTFDPVKACYPDAWKSIAADESMMLAELLDSGIFGDSSMSRKHSSNMTLDAVRADREGKKTGKANIRKSLFPTVYQLKDRYTYLRKYPFLLPAAWISRIVGYAMEMRKNKQPDNNAFDSIRIGNERIALLKQYGVIR